MPLQNVKQDKVSEDNWDTGFTNNSVNAPYMLADAQCKISSQCFLLMCVTITTEIDKQHIKTLVF